MVDAKRRSLGVREAHRLGIPVIAIADTNVDPELIDFPIPGNDDAIRAVSLIAGEIANAIAIARREVPDEQLRRQAELEATTYSTETGEKSADTTERRPRPRKRRPRPEAIAQVRKAGDGDGAAAKGTKRKSRKSPASRGGSSPSKGSRTPSSGSDTPAS